MKITIIGPSYPLRGGIAHHVFWLKRKLTDSGHTVQVISFRKLYPGLIFPGTTQTDTSNLKLDAGGRRLLTPLNPVRWFMAASEVKAFDPDVIVIQWWQPFFAPVVGTLARIFKRAGKKVVVECHNILPHEGTPADRLLVKYAFSPVEHFITHSHNDRRDLDAIAPNKSVSVSALPSLEEFYRESIPT
ncbi:MAG TPA: glycosyltransferase family 4 protein, partial [Blastocatellia bacterium]|nr:glycosyltransferase family 4 protein [Blastocatellia bacterium]